jgi:hypothetical protein
MGNFHYDERWKRHLSAKIGEHFGELWNDNGKHDYSHQNCDYAYDDGVGHCRFNFSAQSVGFFLVFGETQKHAVKISGRFTSGNHVAEKLVEDLFMFSQCVGQGASNLDVTGYLLDGAGKNFIFGLRGQNIEALDKGQPRRGHRGKLSCKPADLLELYAGTDGKI